MYNNIGNIVTLLCPNYTPKEPLLDSKSYKSLVYIKLHKIKHEHSSQQQYQLLSNISVFKQCVSMPPHLSLGWFLPD